MMTVVLPNTKADAIKYYTGESYIEGNIYEGTPLSDIEIKGDIYNLDGDLIIARPNWNMSKEAQKFAYVTAGMYSHWWNIYSYQNGKEQYFSGIIKFEVIPVPDLVVTETKVVKYPYGTQLSDIKPNFTFTTVARKVVEGTVTWDSTKTPYYGINTYTYTFTPSDSRYNPVSGESVVSISKKYRKTKATLKYKTTKNSITITPKKGYEYSIGGYKWQKSNVFKRLKPNTKYKVYVRYKETKTTYTGGTKKKYIRTKR